MTYLANRLFLQGSFTHKNQAPRRFEPAEGAFAEPNVSEYAEASLATLWAPAKVFQMKLRKGQRDAVEAWFSLHALYVLGKLHLRSVSHDVMKEALPALHRVVVATRADRARTFGNEDRTSDQRTLFLGSRGGDNLDGLSSDVIVAGWYNTLGFYPGPDEQAWSEADLGKCYVPGRGLVWEAVLEELLQHEHGMHDHFARVVKYLVEKNDVIADRDIRGHLKKFPATFRDRLALEASAELNRVAPEGWPYFGDDEPDPEKARKLLESYPLQYTASANAGGKRYYLLVRGFERTHPGNEWIGRSVSGMPKPEDFRFEPKARTVSFNVGPRQYQALLEENEEVLELVSERLTTHVTLDGLESKLLRRDLHCPAEAERPRVVVAPVKSTLAFLIGDGLPLKRQDDTWTVGSGQRSVSWITQRRDPKDCPQLQQAYLDIWPSWRCTAWKFYAARSSSRENSTGPTWELVLAGGRSPQAMQVTRRKATEFISATDPTKTDSDCFGGAVALRGDRGADLGALFLALDSFEERDLPAPRRRPDVAIDFGTSNTCVSYYNKSGEPESLYLPGTAYSTRVLGHRDVSDYAFFPEARALPPNVKEYFASLLLTPVKWEPSGPASARDTCLQAVIPALRGKEDHLKPTAFASDGWTLHDRLKWDGAKGFREAYLTVLSMLVQAELFYKYHLKGERWAFTFPLALKDHDGFKAAASSAVRASFALAFGPAAHFDESSVTTIPESRAIHRIIDSSTPAKFLDLFLDLGAGTTDLAIVAKDKAIVLDSILVAGNAFFDIWREIRKTQTEAARRRRAEEEAQISKSVDKLFRRLPESPSARQYYSELSGKVENSDDTPLEPAIRFSLCAGALRPEEYGERCEEATEYWHRTHSYAQFRARGLFRQLIGWGVGQALAVTRLPEYRGHALRLNLSGNGWGLLMFAGLPRRKKALLREVEDILETLTASRTPEEGYTHPRIEAVEILSEDPKRGFVQAKTMVAEGALRLLEDGGARTIQTDETGPLAAVWLPIEYVNETLLSTPVLLAPETRWREEALLSACNTNPTVGLRRLALAAPPPGRERDMLGGLDDYILLLDTKTLTGIKLKNLDPSVWRNLAGNLVEFTTTEDGPRASWRSPVRVLLEDRLYPAGDSRAVFEDVWTALSDV